MADHYSRSGHSALLPLCSEAVEGDGSTALAPALLFSGPDGKAGGGHSITRPKNTYQHYAIVELLMAVKIYQGFISDNNIPHSFRSPLSLHGLNYFWIWLILPPFRKVVLGGTTRTICLSVNGTPFWGVRVARSGQLADEHAR